MIEVAIVLVAIGMTGFVVRAVRGPSLADRVVAVDGLVVSIIAIMLLVSVRIETHRFVDIALVVAFVGFVGAAAGARFIERRGG